MSFKQIWKDVVDAIEGVENSGTDVSAKEINNIAHAVIQNENDISGLKQKTLSIEKDVSNKTTQLETQINDANNEIQELKKEIVVSANKFNNIFDLENSYINTTTNTIEPSSKYNCTSEYIPLGEGLPQKMYVKASKTPTGFITILYYDENKTFIRYMTLNSSYSGNSIYRSPQSADGTTYNCIKYFRLYADKDYDGQIYISDVDPSTLEHLSYEYKSVTEVEDIRTGYDGTEYSTAGDAVRQQITDLYKKKQDVSTKVVSDNKFNGVFDLYGYSVNANGETVESSPYKCTSLIPLYDVPVKYAYFAVSKLPTTRVYFTFYDENKVRAVGVQILPTTDLSTIRYTYNSTTNIKYFNIYTEKEYDGQIYVSPHDPSSIDAVDYEYRVEPDQIDKLKDKVIVNFGDSIFGNYLYPNDISTELAKLTDATVHNCAFGGCRMGYHTQSMYDAFSMYRLADAIATKDWSLQDNAISSANILNKQEHLDTLKSLDFNDVDIVTIAYGTNDCYSGSLATDNADNLYDTTTFGGALRYSIETLLNAYPHLKIFICSQTYRFWVDDNNVFTEDSDTKTSSKENTLTDFVEKTKEIAKEYKLPYIDNYYSLGINKFNKLNYFGIPSGSSSIDGTHPILAGRRLIAAHIANELF